MGSFLISSLTFFYFGSYAQKYVLNSPCLKLPAEIEINREITVKMMKRVEPILNLLGLGVVTNQTKKRSWKIKKTNWNTVDKEIKSPIRNKREMYKNFHNVLILSFRSDQSRTFILFIGLLFL